MSINDDQMRMNINLWVSPSPSQKLQEVRIRHVERYSPNTTGMMTKLFFVTMMAVVALGWRFRKLEYLSAKDGLGYYLGIVGSVMMLLLLLYPLRKKARFMKGWGEVKHWFKAHKVLGIVGPILVLFHANFRLHAVNSNVALFSMLLVVLSGLLGRYIYVKIHFSHYGQRMSLQELQRQFGISRAEMDEEATISPRVKDELHGFEQSELAPAKGVLGTCWRLLILGRRAAWVQRKALRHLREDMNEQARRGELLPAMISLRLRHDRELIHEYLLAVKRVSEYGVYCRIFSWWHILHIPLFVMLVVTAIVHVIAVHMY
ncbi:MAG: hypothetical protein FIA97_13360 [Methylococcaceae bacterium]|nr:hypothetical protein [Desulfuromonas sp.]NJD07468.1 hypothetical protein [Methylococcaceae bacterium]